MSKNIVIVYGSLLSGLGNHGVMKAAEGKLLGHGVSVENIDMYSRGGFPSISLQHSVNRNPIVIEAYEVEDENMHIIDRLEGYRGEGKSNFYDRSPIEVELQDGTVLTGLVYHIDTQGQFPVVSGDWREYHADANNKRNW